MVNVDNGNTRFEKNNSYKVLDYTTGIYLFSFYNRTHIIAIHVRGLPQYKTKNVKKKYLYLKHNLAFNITKEKCDVYIQRVKKVNNCTYDFKLRRRQ